LPLFIDRDTTSFLTFEVDRDQQAQDLTAAWMSDELSWRIELCARRTVIPVRSRRSTRAMAIAGCRVFEHLRMAARPRRGTMASCSEADQG